MMSKSKKRKIANCDVKEPSYVHCILHKEDKNPGEFIPFSSVRGSPSEKLHFLQDIRSKRMNLPHNSPYRMEDVCRRIPQSIDDAKLKSTGYHRGCYQSFTKNQDRLPKSPEITFPETETSSCTSTRRSSITSICKPLFPPECIFCGKLEKKVSKRTERCVKFPIFKAKDGSLKEPAWTAIEHQALELKHFRLHRIVQGEDLFAREANFHPSCREAFHLDYLRHSKYVSKCSSETELDKLSFAYSKAFSTVIDFINEQVVQQNKVIQLSYLRSLYVEELEECGFSYPDFRGEKLRIQLSKHDIANLISFTVTDTPERGCITHTLIYSSSMTVADAVSHAYMLGTSDKCVDVAKLLRNGVLRAFNESASLAWPPTANDLDICLTDELLPLDQKNFLGLVIGGNKLTEISPKAKRLVLSIGQVIIQLNFVHIMNAICIFIIFICII